MLRDLGHPAAAGAAVYDTTYENVQAGRAHLAPVPARQPPWRAWWSGTGDLSELALGWCTYGVGDQMSHYNVNASVPKTLVQFLIRWVADANELGDGGERGPALGPRHRDLARSSSGDRRGGLEPGQDTESVVGPFELQDFFLYYVLRFGYRPSKVAFLAHQCLARPRARSLARSDPRGSAATSTRSPRSSAGWRSSCERFFETSQFKRSALPNAPKVGSGGSLSPRGDWRAPSDASAAVWLEELHRNVPDST